MADKLLKSIKFPTLPDRYVIGDSTLTEEGAAADAKATGDEITNVKSALDVVIDSDVYLKETKTYTGYYIQLDEALTANKPYLLKITTATSGTYSIQAGTDGGASYMVDTIGSFQFTANVPQTVCWYKPTGDYNWFRASASITWTLDVYEQYDKSEIEDAVKSVDEIKLTLENELITANASYLVGFSGSLTNGYTYDGTTDGGRLRFDIPTTQNDEFLLEFDCSYDSGECVSVAFSGTNYIDHKTLCYNGSTHIIVPIKSQLGNGAYLNFWAENKVSFTLTNISLKRITKVGDGEKTLSLLSILSKANTDNLGYWNVIVGGQTALLAIGSTRTIAIGNFVLGSLQTGHRNIGIGTFSMSQMETGENNVSIGADAMLAVKRGHDNVAIGKSAMYNGENLEDNIAIGDYALSGSPSRVARYNVAIGKNAGVTSNGTGNTLVGHQAGYRFYSGDYNTMIGFNSLGRNNGNYNICIGNNTEFAENVNDSIAIGKGVKTSKNGQMILGSTDIDEVVLCGNKKIVFNNDGTITWEEIS